MLSRLLEALLGWFAQLILGARRDVVAHDDAVALGRAEAASETQMTVREVADAQAHVDDGPDRGDLLAAELRARAARLGGGLGTRV